MSFDGRPVARRPIRLGGSTVAPLDRATLLRIAETQRLQRMAERTREAAALRIQRFFRIAKIRLRWSKSVLGELDDLSSSSQGPSLVLQKREWLRICLLFCAASAPFRCRSAFIRKTALWLCISCTTNIGLNAANEDDFPIEKSLMSRLLSVILSLKFEYPVLANESALRFTASLFSSGLISRVPDEFWTQIGRILIDLTHFNTKGPLGSQPLDSILDGKFMSECPNAILGQYFHALRTAIGIDCSGFIKNFMLTDDPNAPFPIISRCQTLETHSFPAETLLQELEKHLDSKIIRDWLTMGQFNAFVRNLARFLETTPEFILLSNIEAYISILLKISCASQDFGATIMPLFRPTIYSIFCAYMHNNKSKMTPDFKLKIFTEILSLSTNIRVHACDQKLGPYIIGHAQSQNLFPVIELTNDFPVAFFRELPILIQQCLTTIDIPNNLLQKIINAYILILRSTLDPLNTFTHVGCAVRNNSEVLRAVVNYIKIVAPVLVAHKFWQGWALFETLDYIWRYQNVFKLPNPEDRFWCAQDLTLFNEISQCTSNVQNSMFARCLLSLDERVARFYKINKFSREFNIAPVFYSVNRSKLYEEGLNLLYKLEGRVKKFPLITFVNDFGMQEIGIDGGGVTREFVQLMLDEMTSPTNGVVIFADNGEIELADYSPENSRKYFVLGALLGKALQLKLTISPLFSRTLLNIMTGSLNNLFDLNSKDPVYFQSLSSLMCDPDVESLGLTFSLPQVSATNKLIITELVHGGKDIPVTTKNQVNYVRMVVNHRLNFENQESCIQLLNGIYHVLEPATLTLFCASELSLLISGSETKMCIDNLRENVAYNGYTPDDDTMQIFWRVITDFDELQRMKFMFFVTSRTRAPVLGFSHIEPKICIQRSQNSLEYLPTSSTCMNILRLPPYDSYELMRDKLLKAINVKAGFELS